MRGIFDFGIIHEFQRADFAKSGWQLILSGGPVDNPFFPDLWFDVPIAFEQLLLGDSQESIAAMLDDAAAVDETPGLSACARG